MSFQKEIKLSYHPPAKICWEKYKLLNINSNLYNLKSCPQPSFIQKQIFLKYKELLNKLSSQNVNARINEKITNFESMKLKQVEEDKSIFVDDSSFIPLNANVTDVQN